MNSKGDWIGEGSPVSQETLTSPFTEDIMAQPLPRDFRFPTIKLYSGSVYPRAHINRYRTAIMMTDASDTVMCRGFFATLDGQAQNWFTTLPEGSISSFSDLSGRFLSHFASSIPKKKQFATMCKLEQGSAESLTDYLAKWKREARSVGNFNEKTAIPIFIANVRSSPFHRDLVQNQLKSYATLLDRATRFAEAEEAERKKKEEERCRRDKAPQEDRRAPRPPRQGPRLSPLRCLTPLTHPLSAILEHTDRTRHTEECMVLKRQIEELIQRGYIGQSFKRSGQGRPQGPGSVWKKKGGSEPPASGSHKRELGQFTEEEEKELDEPHLHEKEQRREPITFTDDDLPDGPLPHRDALEITLDINNIIVHRVLVGTGCSVNVMYYNTFTKLGLSMKHLAQVRTALSGFTGDSIGIKGSINLEVEIGT
ncbi:uncharacterized protein LOC116027521 [Ipomoea triloba]|uniref:uncharacterized protein LOC116027521 n=1 Tax=Ipomoea triloba TaxID=35885 RepID=UPI00125DDD5D|nr:uncharacterized protein LOC116027521 [Ipomoea triloba]